MAETRKQRTRLRQRSRQRAKQQRSSRTSFEKLEARNLLAADMLASADSVLTTCTVDTVQTMPADQLVAEKAAFEQATMYDQPAADTGSSDNQAKNSDIADSQQLARDGDVTRANGPIWLGYYYVKPTKATGLPVLESGSGDRGGTSGVHISDGSRVKPFGPIWLGYNFNGNGGKPGSSVRVTQLPAAGSLDPGGENYVVNSSDITGELEVTKKQYQAAQSTDPSDPNHAVKIEATEGIAPGDKTVKGSVQISDTQYQQDSDRIRLVDSLFELGDDLFNVVH